MLDQDQETERTAKLVKRFTAAHFETHPENASTLGAEGYAHRLSSPSREAALRQLSYLRATLNEAMTIHAAGASIDVALDLDGLERIARFHARAIEHDRDAENLETAALPNAALHHSALHARSLDDIHALIERARAVPAYLREHAENLRRGVKDGRAADRDVATIFAERILPGAARSIEAIVGDVGRRIVAVPGTDAALGTLSEALAEASAAYRAMAKTVAEEILPHGRRHVVLGGGEVAFRLRDVMGVETPIDVLLANAESRLARAHEEIVEHARIAGHANVKHAVDARDVVIGLFASKAETTDEAIHAYEAQLAAATRFVREREVVPIPADLALALEPLPDGIADGCGLTNWPAPLLNPAGRGHALYSRNPDDHPKISAKQLAIHEGIPGHYLQSAVWQRSPASPVRFLGVTDDVAISQGYFGTMVSVEGWAVHMEDVMVREGFFEPGHERMFAAWCDAVRAARVIFDLGLHAQAARSIGP